LIKFGKKLDGLVVVFAILLFVDLLAPIGLVRAARDQPLLKGWGGVYISESVRYKASNPPSIVFPGEKAPNAEVTMRLLREKGYNTIRVMFESPYLGRLYPDRRGWHPDWLNRTVTIAKALLIWVIVDYHARFDAYQLTDDWIAFWRDNIITKYKNAYKKIVWEPINEPVTRFQDGSNKLKGLAGVEALRNAYQKWIDMARGLGDSHWIVVSLNTQWDTTIPEIDKYPNVTDPVNRVFLNRHFYYFYESHKDAWGEKNAVKAADKAYSAVIDVINKYKKPFLSTEMGAQYSTSGLIPPDAVDADKPYAYQYSNTTLAYIRRLVSNFRNGGIGYMLWSAGDWTGLVGGSINTWGKYL